VTKFPDSLLPFGIGNLLEIYGGIIGFSAVGAAAIDFAGAITITVFDCDHIGGVIERLKTAQQGLQQSINENQAELQHALATRDILIARINALQDELSEVYQANAARVLDAKTLDLKIIRHFPKYPARKQLERRIRAFIGIAERFLLLNLFKQKGDPRVLLVDAYP